MKIDVQGLNLPVTEAIENYVHKKIQRATKHCTEFLSSVKVNLMCENKSNTHLVEVIVFLHGGKTLHNKTRSEDMYASIDIACASMERQIRKIKEKHNDIKRHKVIEEKLGEVPEIYVQVA
jgi:putative sigma-54 modulation protein